MTPLIFALALTLPFGPPPPPTPIEFYMPGVEIDPPVLVPVVKLAPPIQPSAAPVSLPPSAVAVVPKKGPFFGTDCRGQKWKGPDEQYLKAFIEGRDSVLKAQQTQSPPLYYAPPMTFQGVQYGAPCFT